MNSKTVYCVLGVILLGTSLGQPQTKRASKIFSDVEYIEESGDLVGFELSLSFDGAHASGEFRDYEGACGIRTQVAGTITDQAIHLKGARDRGRIEIDGKLEKGQLDATVKMVEGQTPQKVRLKLISRAHC